MEKKELVAELVGVLGEKKYEFLADVEEAIKTYVSGQGTNCLSLVERNANGTISSRWALSASPGYVRRLTAFCLRKKVGGRNLDSGLTDPIIRIVIRKFEELYESSSEEISKTFLSFLLKSQTLSQSLVNTLVQSKSARRLSDEAKQRLAAFILAELKVVLGTAAAKSVIATTSKAVLAAVSKPIAHKLAMLMMKYMAVQLKIIIIKILSSAAVKKIIALAVKKFLLAAVMATLIKLIMVKFGISAGAALWGLLLPLIAAYIVYEVATFPRHLGEKVAAKIAEDLSGSFGSINEEITGNVVDEFLDKGIGALADSMMQEQAIQDGLEELINSYA